MLVDTLDKIHNAREAPAYKATTLQLGGIDSAMELSESRNCFEFLIISLCRNFGLTSKQGAALLTSNNKYLAQITAKGFRGDFSPVLQWYRDIYGNAGLLTGYMKAEEQENSLKCVLNAIKHGLMAEDSEIVQWCINVFSRIVLEAGDIGLLGPIWSWFTRGNNSALTLIIALAQRKDNELTAALVELLLLFGDKYYSELFSVLIPPLCNGSGKYFAVMAEFLPYLTENSGIMSEIEASGVISYWFELGMNQLEPSLKKDHEVKSEILGFLAALAGEVSRTLGRSELAIEGVLSLLARNCRDSNWVFTSLIMNRMFSLLIDFAVVKSPFASTIYKSLVFLLIENYSNEATRELLSYNFVNVLSLIPGIPVSILTSPLVKLIQKYRFELQIFDIELCCALANSPQLTLRSGIELLDSLGNVYQNNLVLARACAVPLTCLMQRFAQRGPMKEYLDIFCRYHVQWIVSAELEARSAQKPPLAQKQDLKLKRQSILAGEILSWIIQLEQEGFNENLKMRILEGNHVFCAEVARNCVPLLELLRLYGEPEGLINGYLNEGTSKGHLSEEQAPASLFHFAKSTANLTAIQEKTRIGIEKARQKHAEKVKKDLEEQETAVKKLENSFKPSMKVHRKERRTDSLKNYMKMKEFSQEDQKFIEIFFKQHSQAFEFMFSSYSRGGHQRKSGGIPDPDWQQQRKRLLNEPELLKMLTEYQVIPILLPKQDFKELSMLFIANYMPKTDHRSMLEFHQFQSLFARLSVFVYPNSPPVYSVRQLLFYIKETQHSKNHSVFEFKQSGEIIPEDPNYTVPEGYAKYPDIQFTVAPLPTGPKRISQEILDELIFHLFSFRIISPEVSVSLVYRLKPISPAKHQGEKTLLHQAKNIEISPLLTSLVAQAPTEDNSLYGECSKILEKLLRSAQGNSPAQNVKEKKAFNRERARKAEEEKKNQNEHKRLKRQLVLKEQLIKVKLEKTLKLRDEQELIDHEIEIQQGQLDKSQSEQEIEIQQGQLDKSQSEQEIEEPLNRNQLEETQVNS